MADAPKVFGVEMTLSDGEWIAEIGIQVGIWPAGDSGTFDARVGECCIALACPSLPEAVRVIEVELVDIRNKLNEAIDA